MSDSRIATSASVELVAGLLEEAERCILKDISQLEFAGLLKNHVYNYPDLNETVRKAFADLRTPKCAVCLHPKAEHFYNGERTHCCDGCSGYQSASRTDAAIVERFIKAVDSQYVGGIHSEHMAVLRKVFKTMFGREIQ